MQVKRKKTKIINELKNKKNKYVSVGILKGNYPEEQGGKNIAEVALFNEFGTKNIPERSFIRSTLQENKNYKAIKEKLAKKIIKSELEEEQALTILGQKVKQDIQNKIVELREPPNKAITIYKKGSSNPLIDTGLLKNSIDYEVTNVRSK